MKTKNLIVTALAIVGLGAAIISSNPAQAQIPVAGPEDRPDVNLTRFPNNHGQSYTNGAGVVYTNASVGVTPGEAFNLTVVLTNCPSVGSNFFHFDTSSTLGLSYTGQGLQSNGVFVITNIFTSTMRSNTVEFTTVVTAAQAAGITDVKLRRGVPANVGTTNVCPYRFYITRRKGA